MIINREDQLLTLNGSTYNKAQIKELVRSTKVNKSPEMSDLFTFLSYWFDESDTLIVQTSGSTGAPKKWKVRKDRMMQSARLTCEFLDLRRGDTALLCMNLRYIGAMMIVVRSLVCGLNLIVRPASGHPLKDVNQPIDFAAMVPLQVYNTLQSFDEKEKLIRVKCLIIGGGTVDERLQQALSDFPYPIYSTYGMTETLSHIALRRLNGSEASSRYVSFDSVCLSLSAEQTLVIDAPLVSDGVLVTNDIAHLYPDGTFEILGRKDNVINSGGIKIQIEQLEQQINKHFDLPFAVTSVPDCKLGEAVVMLIAGDVDIQALLRLFSDVLPAYHSPKYLITVDSIPLTETGKIDRAACKKMALEKQM